MSFNHIFYNNQISKDIRNKIQKSATFMFPKITQSSKKPNKISKNLYQDITQKIYSDKELYRVSSNKKQPNSTQKIQLIYRMTTRDILNMKSKSSEGYEFQKIQKIKQKNKKDNNILLSKKQIVGNLDQKMKQTLRSINKMRTTFVVKKNSNLNETSSKFSNKKSIGNYSILKEIGHGGFAVVHEACHNQSKKTYAIKQYNVNQSWECYKNQSTIGDFFFKDSKPKFQFTNSIGISSIVQFIQKIKINRKAYIVQQLCGTNFSKLLSEINGVFYNKERVYEVRFLPFYQKMKKKDFFLSIILPICQGIKLLNENGFVHCDLKLQNILIEHRDNLSSSPIVKVIDFGSTFEAAKGLPKITITPEYMPPQLLLQFDKNNVNGSKLMHDKIDVWSIGCILLEIFTGVPLWFRYKCKIQARGRNKLELSLFALTNRDYGKIIKKQGQLCQNLIKIIGFVCEQWQKYRKLLRRIFVMDPSERISVGDLIKQLQQIN